MLLGQQGLPMLLGLLDLPMLLGQQGLSLLLIQQGLPVLLSQPGRGSGRNKYGCHPVCLLLISLISVSLPAFVLRKNCFKRDYFIGEISPPNGVCS